MNRTPQLIAILASLAFSCNAFAGFKLPNGVYTFGEIEEAKAEAAEKGRPIAFLWSDTGSS